jgi:hypothetical protein
MSPSVRFLSAPASIALCAPPACAMTISCAIDIVRFADLFLGLTNFP